MTPVERQALMHELSRMVRLLWGEDWREVYDDLMITHGDDLDTEVEPDLEEDD